MSGFPFCRLPFLAAKAVVNRMDLGDLTALFLCSKTTQQFIKTLRKPVSFVTLSVEQKNSLNILEIMEMFREEKPAGKLLKGYGVEVDIKISDDIGFELNVLFDIREDDCKDLYFRIYAENIDQQGHYTGSKSHLTIGDVEVPVVITKKDEMYMFWDNKQDGFGRMGYFFVENFTNSFAGLKIKGGISNDFSENLRLIVNWMHSTNADLMHCKIKDHNQSISDEDFKFVVDYIHPSYAYVVNVKLSDIFQHTLQFKTDSLVLKAAKWFTSKTLLMTDCEDIHLQKSKLTNNDLKEYLKQWTAGKFSKLKSLYVEMQEDMDIYVILSDLEGSPMYEITRRKDKVRIKRNDGHVAKISRYGRTSKTFEMKIL